MEKLAGKAALITGAGSGIGQATAILFAKEGAKVVVADYAPGGGQETVKMIREAGGEAVFVQADVTRAADVERMVKAAVDAYGRIDILFSNAGILRFGTTADTTEEDWDLVLDTNLKGVFLCSKYTIPVMLKQGKGVIINTASTSGLMGSPGMPAYSASKAGVINLTKATALEYARQNIRANCVCPGATETQIAAAIMPDEPSQEAFRQTTLGMTPLGRIARPSEIAEMVLYLASDESSFVTGAVFAIDGGLTACPVAPAPR